MKKTEIENKTSILEEKIKIVQDVNCNSHV